MKKRVSRKWRLMASTLSKTGDKNHCAVIALAITTGQPVLTVQATLADCGRIKGEGTTRDQIQSALRHLGFTTRAANHTEEGQKLAKCKTVNQIDNQAGKGLNGRKFLAIVQGHVLAVENDQVQDWTRDRKHLNLGVWEVIDNNA